MTTRASLLLLGWIGCAGGWNAPLAAQRVDSITLISGRPVRGTISQVTPDTITVTSDNGSVTVDPWNVRRIRFGDEPGEVTRAKSSFADDRFNACLEALDRLAESSVPPLLQQDIEYYRAAAMGKISLGGGSISATQAAAALKAFFEQYPQSFHVVEAVDLFADLALAQGHFSLAAEQFGRVAASPWPERSLMATLKSGRALMLDGKPAEAIEALGRVEASQSAEDYALQAKLVARCLRAQALAESGQPDQAIDLATKVISSESHENQALFARAYNALGTAYLKQGQLKMARDAFLHTDLLFHTDPDAHAEALFQLYGIWNQLNRADRAGEVRQTIKDRYRNTFWSDKLG